ncbi:hypothetical protein Pmani_023364 [Petrolisthes manimaculis]|uniref:Uncharacterized protein n=1 Tax=Petrolisthes manimaculis TaxID=1843537 RepID=A0AAE1U164_9EUCA|nr:hypothetical protein Pmani_023364 [Petrolisthes manimaculis]
MDGETHVLDGPRGSDPLSRILPITWYLIPTRRFRFPYGVNGRFAIRLPDTTIATSSNVMRIDLRMRVADPKDLDKFHLSFGFTPDLTFVNVITLDLNKTGIFLGHH